MYLRICSGFSQLFIEVFFLVGGVHREDFALTIEDGCSDGICGQGDFRFQHRGCHVGLIALQLIHLSESATDRGELMLCV